MTSKYCPDWIFDSVTAEIGAKFIATHYELGSLSQKYSRGLSKIYYPIEAIELQATSEVLLEFLLKIKADEAAFDFLMGFAYYRVNFHLEIFLETLSQLFLKLKRALRSVSITAV